MGLPMSDIVMEIETGRPAGRTAGCPPASRTSSMRPITPGTATKRIEGSVDTTSTSTMSLSSGHTMTRASPSTGRGRSSSVVAVAGTVAARSLVEASAAKPSAALAAISHCVRAAR
jgi:hypothetical protein